MTAAERSHLHLVHDVTKPIQELAVQQWTHRVIDAGHAFVGDSNVEMSTHHTSAWRQIERSTGTLTVITNRTNQSSHNIYDAVATYTHTRKGIVRIAAGYDNEKGWNLSAFALPNSKQAIRVAEAFFDVDMTFIHTPSDLIEEVRALGVQQRYTTLELTHSAQQVIKSMQTADKPQLRDHVRRRLRQTREAIRDFVNPE